jgi:hypothetical protein
MGYVQLMRTPQTEELMKFPECFILLTLIAYRARRTNDGFNPHGLEIGQAVIGDYKSIGLSSEKVYRNAKKKLEIWKLAAFKGTNKGTIATILNSDVYDINEEIKGEQKGGQGADKGRTAGEPGATKKNGNNEKKEKNVKKDSNGNLFETVDFIQPFENIEVSPAEHEKLVSTVGEQTAAACYSHLHEYKIEKNYKTKSDYLTIKRWVIDAVNKKNGNGQGINKPTNGINGHTRDAGAHELLNSLKTDWLNNTGRGENS